MLPPAAVSFFANQNSTPTAGRPKAYLNVLFFDEQFKIDATASKYQQVGTGSMTPGNPGQVGFVAGSAVLAQKSGYCYIYISNESDELVYFDNLTLTHERGPLLEETHYYPFGLTMAGISSKAAGTLTNKIKFNGKEEQRQEFSDGSGLEWLDYGARMYDPQIARYFVKDPLTEFMANETPYHYCHNNPIKFIDFMGLAPMYNRYDRKYYDNGKEVSWDDVQNYLQESGGIEATYKPLDKNRLDEMGEQAGYGTRGTGAFNANVGNAFESVALRALGLDKNGNAMPSAQRAAKTGGKKSLVQPDAVGTIRVNFSKMAGHFFDIVDEFDEGILWVEVKGIKAASIPASYDQHQITGEIDALSQTAAGAQNRSVLTLVTLGYTFPGPSTLKAAADKHVSIYMIWALEQYIDGKPSGNIAFSLAFPMYEGHKGSIPLPVGFPVNTGAFPLPPPTKE